MAGRAPGVGGGKERPYTQVTRRRNKCSRRFCEVVVCKDGGWIGERGEEAGTPRGMGFAEFGLIPVRAVGGYLIHFPVDA